MIVIETERLILRHLEWEDVDALAAIMGDPDVMRYIGTGAPKTRSDVERLMGFWIADNERSWPEDTLARLPQLRRAIDRDAHFGLWATVHKKDRKLIGRCGLLAWNLAGRHETEVGYLLAKKYWGQGLATEAARGIRDYGFDVLGFERLVSLIKPENVASQRVAEKCGMTYGHHAMVNGTPARVYSVNLAAPLAGRSYTDTK
jgi:[ribosomal protein S5]-alanine N-acetyltransferase